jgi:hypothetical protein
VCFVVGVLCLGGSSGGEAELFFGDIEEGCFDFANGLVGEFVDGVDDVVEECLELFVNTGPSGEMRRRGLTRGV